MGTQLRRSRFVIVSAGLILSAGLLAGPAVQAAPPPRFHSEVAGGAISTPTFLPLQYDSHHGAISGASDEVLDGSWTGASVVTGTVYFDPATMDMHGHLVETFQGLYVPGHSRGTLVFDEAVTGNLITGEVVVQAQIVKGTGDPTFACSSGHVTFAYHADVAEAYGGYVGTWHHGCRR